MDTVDRGDAVFVCNAVERGSCLVIVSPGLTSSSLNFGSCLSTAKSSDVGRLKGPEMLQLGPQAA